ncbi:hypothetical protein [Paenibacillus tianjinensis]|uniref:Uncharacterized protein n=1 Tax=Paenibacillus tianjinensis TaxID=2810347 RepID=A0ABX7LG23_9BACL|nr:hypothetical protein [Paenibacillus tianjinensis]QSF47017.1 hypothetical protein JRJ22_10860 [Paenibacillus tianjinensis]
MILLLLSGCGALNGKPAGEELNLVLAGMDGSDAVSFEGAAALLIGGQPVSESALYYGGKIEDHNKVSLYSLLPDKPGMTKAAAQEGLNKLEKSRSATPAYYTRLEKKDGEWQIQSAASPESGAGNPLAALNPLRQLEELEHLEKQVTEETGSGRGSKVLRIQLSPGEARRQLKAELEQEMQAIRPEAGKAQDTAGRRTEVAAAMNTLWVQKENELQQKLAEAEITSVYFLKVDNKRNLPKRLTWTRTVSYPASADPAEVETYVTKVDFYGYH